MYMPSNKIIAIILFAVTAALLAVIFTHKNESSPSSASPSASKEENTVANYIADVELKNELERDEIEQARKLAKQAKAKKESVECQFWTQQKANNPTSKNRKIEEKITQFCELEDATTPIATTKTGT